MPFPWFRKAPPQLPAAIAEAMTPAPVPVSSTVPARRDDGDELDGQVNALNAFAAISEMKEFDWMHYQAVRGGSAPMFGGEFNIIPTIRIMKGMYVQEFWINACTAAIARQFLTSRLVLKKQTSDDGSEQTIKKHPLLNYMRFAGADVESLSFFVSNAITDLVICGNAYWWNSKDLSTKRRLPAERVDPVVENNKVTGYRLLDKTELGIGEVGGGKTLTLAPEEVTHIKYPNPFSPHFGMSMLIATILPVLIDKYGLEYVVGFFLRGGNTAGIIETSTSNMDKLLRLARSMMQAFGGRKNMHADKVLPEGAKWAGQGHAFGEIGLADLLKQNQVRFRAATGCTNAVCGTSDNTSYAQFLAEMKVFYKMTILPLQFLFCQGIESSSLWQRFKLDENWALEFDNSQCEYLNNFEQLLDDDAKLQQTWTVNERRERFGKDPVDGYDKLFAEITKAATPIGAPVEPGDKGTADLAVPKNADQAAVLDAMGQWKSAEIQRQEPSKAVHGLFAKEFGAWEQIVLDNLRAKDTAMMKVHARAADFAASLAEKTLPAAMAAYDNQVALVRFSKVWRDGGLRHLKPGADGRWVKESDEDRQAKIDALRQRAKDVVGGKILKNGERRFLGYSKTQMDRVYKVIEDTISDGGSLTDAAKAVRAEFDEAYEGQAATIVRTEFNSALSIGQAQFGEDLSTVTSKMSKTWVTMGDDHVRSSHADLDDVTIEGDSADVVDEVFTNGLRYPRDPESGDPSEVINCRCTIRYSPVEWS